MHSPEGVEAVFQGGDFSPSLADVPEGLLEVVALYVHDDDIGQGKGIVGERGREGLLFQHAAADEGLHLGVFRLNGGDPAVEVGYLPVGARRGALHADDELAGFTGLAVYGVGHDPGHDGAHKAHAHDDDDFTPLQALFLHQLLKAFEFPVVLFLLGKGKRLAGGAGGNLNLGVRAAAGAGAESRF